MTLSSPLPEASSSYPAVSPPCGPASRRPARAAGRDPADVTLIAVSKTQPPDAIDAALATGQRVFGENRVQEAQARWTDRAGRRCPTCDLRLIGPLQTNKVREAVALFDVIETLDRPKLARPWRRRSRRLGGLRRC